MLYGLGIELERPASGDSHRALSGALRRNLSVYDGSYIALAIRHATKVITADGKLHYSGKGRYTLLLQDLGTEWEL